MTVLAGTIAAIARRLCHLRYVSLFGPADKSTRACPSPLSPSDTSRVAKVLRGLPVAQTMTEGIKDVERHAGESEIMNFIELSLADHLGSTKYLYEVIYNCFHHTLDYDPNHDSGFGKWPKPGTDEL